MPDPLFLLEVMAGAALVAALMVLVWGWPWRAPHPGQVAIGEALGIGGAFFLGCGIVSRWPRRSLAEAEDRLLLIVLPAIVVVEITAAFRGVPRWLAWALRGVVAAGVTPVLLYNSRYFTDSAGPGTRLWSAAQAVLWLGGLAAVLAVEWLLLVLLARRTSSRFLLLALAVACGGAAPTIMVSGYVTGGLLLVPLAGALVGTAVASCFWVASRGDGAAVGFGVVFLFALLVMGRFFGELRTFHAGLLLFAPLLAWLPEFLPGKKPRTWGRAVPGIILVAIPVVLAFYLAQKPSPASDGAPAPAREPTVEDYQQFGR